MAPRALCMTICGAALVMAVTGPRALAAPSRGLSFVDGTVVAAGTRIVDVRKQAVCEQASLPGARCLPAEDLFYRDGRAVDFHTLRWLLGTIGLSGSERVVVAGADARHAAAVGALLYLAGQRDVAVFDRPIAIPAGAQGGTGRNITREAVFTAPMRDMALVATGEEAGPGVIASGPPAERLRRFAMRTAQGARALRLRLSP